MKNEEMIFSLDIGTRSVIGTVSTYDGENINILSAHMEEHSKRNMYDGQIHDIEGVLFVVNKVKSKLEADTGFNLSKVSIAAAGRALKTKKCFLEIAVDPLLEIDDSIVESLEMEAIQLAQKELQDELGLSEDNTYYYVGHSVSSYYIDGGFIERLQGHRGSKISIDIIATFLPKIVVGSLYTVMEKAGLEVSHMTLEPIAAIEVAIAPNMRLLNLAMVDIGAGTSDIAITSKGSISAYGMVPLAGDELTEHLANSYLLDFDTAESLKTNLNRCETQSFKDVVGIDYELSSEQILDELDSSIRHLATEISNKIIEMNSKAPSAVFLVGGGSQIPRLTQYVSEALGIPPQRVTLKDSCAVTNLQGLPEYLQGPHCVTPVGITMSSLGKNKKDFLEVKVNGNKVNIFNTKDLKVSDALIITGYNPRNLLPKSSHNFKFILNGVERTLPGAPGEAAKILVNNKESNLMTQISSGDEIEIIESTPQLKISASVFEIENLLPKVKIDDTYYSLVKRLHKNGVTLGEKDTFREGEEIFYDIFQNLEEFLEEFRIPSDSKLFKVNGVTWGLDEPLANNDIIESEVCDSPLEDSPDFTFSKVLEVTINGELKTIKHKNDSFIFVNIFDHIDFDISHPKGILVLKLNGKRADYHQVLRSGDNLEIYWDDSSSKKN